MKPERIISAVAVCLLFLSIGWLAPQLAAVYLPADHYITPISLETEDTTVDAETHLVCFTRDVDRPITGLFIRKLLLVGEDGTADIQVDSSYQRRAFRSELRTVQMEFQLPEDLDAGTYQYYVVIEFTVPGTDITKTQEVQSNVFNVTDTNTTSTPTFSCG